MIHSPRGKKALTANAAGLGSRVYKEVIGYILGLYRDNGK